MLRLLLKPKVLIAIAVIVAIGAGAAGVSKYIDSGSKTTKLGFEDIGELATQSAYCSEVNVTDASRELFGLTIPFTQSKYVYSYDVIIKAGIDFSRVKWSVSGNTITVSLPEVKILSNEIDQDSLKVYHEEESIFCKISLADNNEAMKELKANAAKDAVENGLLEEARAGAETMLTGFFAQQYDPEEYTIKFK